MTKRKGAEPDDFAPVYGDGTTDFGDESVEVFARSAAAILPASLRRLDGDTRDSLMDVGRAANHVDQATKALQATVNDARTIGASWSAIGWVLGMTGEGARKRFSPSD